jgi:hypothetical protein
MRLGRARRKTGRALQVGVRLRRVLRVRIRLGGAYERKRGAL